MSLDAPKSDAEYRALADQRMREREQRAPRDPRDLAPPTDAPATRPTRRITGVMEGRSEHDIQVALVQWLTADTTLRVHPELALCYAIPNGGHRSPAVAGKLRAEGVRPGVPDLCLPVARGGYHSLYLELKRPGASLTPEQPHWIAALTRHGHCVVIHTDWESARDTLLEYLQLPPTLPQ